MFDFDLHNSILLFVNILIDLLTIEFFASYFYPYHHKYQYTYIRYAFILINSLFVIIPFKFDIGYITEFLYFLALSAGKIKDSIRYYIKYLIIDFSVFALIAFIIAIINININIDSSLYTYYMTLICNVSVYTLFHLHINRKQMKRTHLPLPMYISFFATYLVSIAVMIYCSRLYGKSSEADLSYSYILLFICGIIVFTLHNYRSIASLMEKQNEQNLLLKKYELEEDFVKNIDSSLQTLSKVRHDFKNHLIILDGYAAKKDTNKLQEYIHRVNEEIEATKLYDTSHNLISSLLNAKNAVCEKKHITFNVEHHFYNIAIDDFSIITILGNIIDNAITAAGKTTQGIIDLSIIQLDSLIEITCKNNHCETITEKDGKLLTTKKTERGFHGIGLENVKTCVENLNGTLDIHYTDSEFEVKIELPNYGKTSEAN